MELTVVGGRFVWNQTVVHFKLENFIMDLLSGMCRHSGIMFLSVICHCFCIKQNRALVLKKLSLYKQLFKVYVCSGGQLA